MFWAWPSVKPPSLSVLPDRAELFWSVEEVTITERESAEQPGQWVFSCLRSVRQSGTFLQSGPQNIYILPIQQESSVHKSQFKDKGISTRFSVFSQSGLFVGKVYLQRWNATYGTVCLDFSLSHGELRCWVVAVINLNPSFMHFHHTQLESNLPSRPPSWNML